MHLLTQYYVLCATAVDSGFFSRLSLKSKTVYPTFSVRPPDEKRRFRREDKKLLRLANYGGCPSPIVWGTAPFESETPTNPIFQNLCCKVGFSISNVSIINALFKQAISVCCAPDPPQNLSKFGEARVFLLNDFFGRRRRSILLALH